MDASPIFLAAFNVEKARLTEFEDWYANEHVPDGLRIPHFTRVTRYQKHERSLPLLESAPRFLNIYTIDDVDNIDEAWLSKERETTSAEFFRWSDALSDGVQGIYVPRTQIDRED